jgi:N-acetylmuramoyl-L-alanine amidase
LGWRWVVLPILAIAGLATFAVVTRGSPARVTRRATAPAPRPTGKSSGTQAVPAVEEVDPSAFAVGACVAFGPTSGDRDLSVFLDAGHGGPDPGAVGTTESGENVHEADLTLPIELDTMEILRSQGFRVIVSRTGPTSVALLGSADLSGDELSPQGVVDDVGARARCANSAHANMLVGIYLDAGDSSANAGGITGYDSVRPFSAQNLRLANLVQADVLAAMNAQGWGIPDDGVVLDSVLGSAVDSSALAYGHLILLGPAKTGYFETPSEMPGALIEPLFITDPFEASIASSAKGQQVIAGGLAEAVDQYFAASEAHAVP